MEFILLIAPSSHKNTTLLFPKLNQFLQGLLKDEWFKIEFWRKNNAISGQSKGRNITWFVTCKGEEWVLRHYYRGGLIGKLLKDKYAYINIQKTRCYQELALLEQMFSQGLPVPKPIAARVIRKHFFYQADLLIEKIPNSQDLVQRLKQHPLLEGDWHAVGKMIAKFHQTGIYHSDLNAHNILIDQQHEFWLIDFDKCYQRLVEDKWQQSNLDRLHRSFLKEKKLHTDFHFDKLCWHWLIQGYQSFYHLDPDARH